MFSHEFEFKVEGNTIGGQATARNRNVKFQEKILKIDTTVESHDATLTFIVFRQDQREASDDTKRGTNSFHCSFTVTEEDIKPI